MTPFIEKMFALVKEKTAHHETDSFLSQKSTQKPFFMMDSSLINP